MKKLTTGRSMLTKFIVRFAALLSLIGLIMGYRYDDSLLKIAEILMLIIWVQMDYKQIKSLFKQE
ncbi:hypothetical protein R4Q63_002694 [Enterobacter cloacae]|nr:hypothetical protein [Enterobacter cloacae]